MQKSYDSSLTKSISQARIAILQARWHAEYTDRMVEKCAELLEKAECELVKHYQVPGCYEIPLAAKRLAQMQCYDAIIVFGAIVKGDTDHYQVILDTCVRELGKVMYDFNTPVVLEILPVHSLEQLVARTTGEHNKGIEGAQAAIEIVAWHRAITSQASHSS